MITALGIIAYIVVGLGAGVAFEDGADETKYTRRQIVTASTFFGALWPIAALYKLGYSIGAW